MTNTKLSKASARAVASVLEKVLRVEANSASCIVLHQPKTSQELQKYRRDQ